MSRPPSRTPAGLRARALATPMPWRLLLAVAASLVAVPMLGAQAPTANASATAAPAAVTTSPAVAEPAPVAGPQLDGMRAGVQTTARTEAPAEAALFQERRRSSQSMALMIVGGAAILIGAFTDSDASGALILGGAVVGLTGLYFYLR